MVFKRGSIIRQKVTPIEGEVIKRVFNEGTETFQVLVRYNVVTNDQGEVVSDDRRWFDMQDCELVSEPQVEAPEIVADEAAEVAPVVDTPKAATK